MQWSIFMCKFKDVITTMWTMLTNCLKKIKILNQQCEHFLYKEMEIKF
jgi:hypothetical protein